MADDLHHAISARLARGRPALHRGSPDLVGVLAERRPPAHHAGDPARPVGLAQSSAYRNLAVLETCGVVHRVAGSDEFARFELAEDLTDHHHHHLICTDCGLVADFTVSDRLERSLEAAMETVADATGFAPDHHRLDLLGRCAACR